MELRDLCRFCATNAADPQIQLFSRKDPNLREIVDKFFPIKISDTDDLPKCICKACFAQVLIVKEFFENLLNADAVLAAKLAAQEREKATRIKIISEKLVRLPISVKKVPVALQKPVAMPSETPNLEATKPVLDISHVLNRLKGVTVKKTKVSVSIDEVTTPPVRRTSSRNKSVSYNSEDLKASTPPKEDSDDEEYKPRTPRTTPKKRKLSNGRSPSSKPIIKMVLNNGPAYVCTTCKSRFDSFEKLKTHMTESQKCKDANVTCQVCAKVCTNRKALYAHSLTHKEKTTVSCDKCGKPFVNRFNLENHMVSAHGQHEETNSVFRCRICEKQFASRNDLAEHMQAHQTQERLCETCGKAFPSANALKVHVRSHGAQNFPCLAEGCDKSFRSQVQLTQHAQVHGDAKLFACPKCDKKFTRKSSLALHAKTHDVTTMKVAVVPEPDKAPRTIEETVIIQPTSGQPSSYTLSFQNF
ncbi:zinc finger protein 384-like [Culicoides brevitarsis]|uniref:zinc finger protein 384-like n=1 Tax=Culicoides brevitarsis TaxID=469753 RepID=UPI00307B8F41